MVPIAEAELEALLTLFAECREFAFFDTSRPDRENSQSLLFLNPRDRLRCRAGEDPRSYLDSLQRCLDQGLYLAGWLAYEFATLLEPRLQRRDLAAGGGKNPVVADFAVYTPPHRFDHGSGEHDFPLPPPAPPSARHYRVADLGANMERQEFLQAIERVRAYIGAGDSYQVNYTMKLLFSLHGSPEGLYQSLRRNQSVAYGAFLRRGGERILSFSPELFFRRSAGQVMVRPMKGTARRGRFAAEDRQRAEELARDPKNRSENVMIVDLLRNDLSHLLHGHGPSRVAVQELFTVEPYESLLQMTSTVQADGPGLRQLAVGQIFRALFPCGSVTGAPKIRTMEIIDELEKGRRGVYTGAIGYLAPDNTAVFNVPIRTIHLQGECGEMGIGAGITYASRAVDEWEESLLKGRFLTHPQPAFYLFETILWQRGGGYWLLERHLARLDEAANFFRFAFDRQAVLARLADEEENFHADCYRLRLELAKDGALHLTSSPWQPPLVTTLFSHPGPVVAAELPLVDFATRPVSTDSAWCFHKTSRRKHYDEQFRLAQAAGCFDRLWCNEKGEVTEGCISNLLIYADGLYRTPALACGLLPGVMRAELLAGRDVPVVEAVLRPEDIRLAEALFLCNSLRGVVRVRLA